MKTRRVATILAILLAARAVPGGLAAADQTPFLTAVAADPLSATFGVPEGTLLQFRRDGLAEPGRLGVAGGFALDEG